MADMLTELGRKLQHRTVGKPAPRRQQWFHGMDLTPWTTDLPVNLTCRDFALAVAERRAKVRGTRQLVARRFSTNHGKLMWHVADTVDTPPAPDEVPC